MGRRLHYIDWLRVLAVLLLVPFHTARVFDQWETFYAKSAATSVPLSWMISVINIWHMPLLFLLAGASSYFALRKRDGGSFIRERALRLLVPLAFGILVILPPQGWVGAMTHLGYTGSLFAYWPRFFRFGDLSGYTGDLSPDHLWFILYLFILSAAAAPFMLAWRKRPGGFVRSASVRLAEPAWWLVPPLVLMLAEGLPSVGGKNPFLFLVYFLLGYIAMADERFMETAERRRVLALAVGAAGIAVTCLTFGWNDSLPDPSLGRAAHVVLQQASAWVTIIGLLGFGKRYLDRPSPLLAYASEASYPFYILHQTVIVVLGFYLLKLGLGVYPAWLLLMGATLVVTLAIYEVAVRRTPVTRFLFGMRPARKLEPVPAEEVA